MSFDDVQPFFEDLFAHLWQKPIATDSRDFLSSLGPISVSAYALAVSSLNRTSNQLADGDGSTVPTSQCALEGLFTVANHRKRQRPLPHGLARVGVALACLPTDFLTAFLDLSPFDSSNQWYSIH
jgi:hypothetical protein